MNEWQPARLVLVHSRKSLPHLAPIVQPEKFKTARKRVVRVREVILPYQYELVQKMLDCGSQRFFEIHPDDCGCVNACVCEHEILTD